MSALPQIDVVEVSQGSPEWLSLRKTKVTATDANIVMGASHWKTRIQLYHEKLSDELPMRPNERMQRGLDLEPIARDLFNIKTGRKMKPAVIVKDWLMASLDGLDEDNGSIVEIKCPGAKDHATAQQGKVPAHYYPQLQHQMYVAGVQKAFYFSFDGMDGVIIEVNRDEEYIENMLIEERKFYDCIINRTPPEPIEGDYVERDDALWEECVTRWMEITRSIRALEKDEEDARKQLVFLSGESNTRGAGISLCQVQRKGAVDYAKIPQLQGVDLDLYRKGSISSWRITCQ